MTGTERLRKEAVPIIRKALRGDRGEIAIFTCFFVVAIIMLIAFLMLYASVRINVINIRNGAKMELNNLAASIYADTYRAQREANFGEYLRTVYSSTAYTQQLEQAVRDGLSAKVPLSTDDYRILNIRLEFSLTGDRIEYVFTCDAEFYIRMFGNSYPTVTRNIRLTGYHNTKF